GLVQAGVPGLVSQRDDLAASGPARTAVLDPDPGLAAPSACLARAAAGGARLLAAGTRHLCPGVGVVLASAQDRLRLSPFGGRAGRDGGGRRCPHFPPPPHMARRSARLLHGGGGGLAELAASGRCRPRRGGRRFSGL